MKYNVLLLLIICTYSIAKEMAPQNVLNRTVQSLAEEIIDHEEKAVDVLISLKDVKPNKLICPVEKCARELPIARRSNCTMCLIRHLFTRHYKLNNPGLKDQIKKAKKTINSIQAVRCWFEGCNHEIAIPGNATNHRINRIVSSVQCHYAVKHCKQNLELSYLNGKTIKEYINSNRSTNIPNKKTKKQ